jgi:hypothetical protein
VPQSDWSGLWGLATEANRSTSKEYLSSSFRPWALKWSDPLARPPWVARPASVPVWHVAFPLSPTWGNVRFRPNFRHSARGS